MVPEIGCGIPAFANNAAINFGRLFETLNPGDAARRPGAWPNPLREVRHGRAYR